MEAASMKESKRPPAEYWPVEDASWFFSIFRTHPNGNVCNELIYLFYNRFSIDIFKMEEMLKHLHGYNPESDESMAEFMDRKFGTGTADYFRLHFLKP